MRLECGSSSWIKPPTVEITTALILIWTSWWIPRLRARKTIFSSPKSHNTLTQFTTKQFLSIQKIPHVDHPYHHYNTIPFLEYSSISIRNHKIYSKQLNKSLIKNLNEISFLFIISSLSSTFLSRSLSSCRLLLRCSGKNLNFTSLNRRQSPVVHRKAFQPCSWSPVRLSTCGLANWCKSTWLISHYFQNWIT